jgi:hypothetical protein
MENDEGNAKMEVLDATKKLNLVEENEPVPCVGTNNENQLRYYTTYNSGDLLCVLFFIFYI